MRRFTLILALVLMVAMPMMAERVTPETARKVATTFLSNNGAKAAQLTDLSKAAGFSNLYIFTAEQGFVVMAADDCVQPILGYSLTGKFVAENMPTNVSGWLQGYNDEIQYAIDSKVTADAETAKLWKDLSVGNSKAGKATVVVDALVKTKWDQDPLYNKFCPYNNDEQELTVTGCVATAMAQIMKYWDYPTHGSGSHTYTHTAYTSGGVYHAGYGTLTANFGNTTYDWANMPLSLSSSSTTEQVDAVATLMYQCGVSVEMDYGINSVGGSGAYSSNIPNALMNYFNYKSGVVYRNKSNYNNTWLTTLKNELNASRPIEYNGSGSGGGHAFVCDGYDNNNYFHFNWGWSGANDGFYSLSNLVPGSGGSGGGSYSFTDNQSAVIGIQPKDCTASAPTNLSVTVEGRTSYLTWNAGTNVSSYSIYKDDWIVANTTNTTYTDANLSYGTHAYYVKSRDANGASSSPTATVTVSVEPIPSNLTVTKDGNNAVLNWTEPEWCLPSYDNEVLTYGDGSVTGSFGVGVAGSMYLYFGHRYPASMLGDNKVIYKVSFYATETGAFDLFLYTANAGSSMPQTQIYTQSITTSYTGWIDIEFDPIQIDNAKDLWAFIYDPEARAYPIGYNATSITDGNYCIWDPYDPTTNISEQDVLFLIRACIADGDFIYNLYDGTSMVAQNISGDTYTVSNVASNKAHQYTLKTDFNGGLTEASNMAGLTVGNASLTSLNMGTNDKMTVTAGSKLTVSGALSNSVAANLVLENGAQLVNSNAGVQATVKKNISPYSQTSEQNDGWNLIASPITESITPTVDNGLLTNEYDLYAFNQSGTDAQGNAREWRNYEAQSFDINNKVGYLYANSGEATLTFTGTLANTATATALVYDGDARFKGFNLIGNPFPCEAYIDRSFYAMNPEGTNFIEGNGSIPPCTAVLVQAQNTSDNSVTFSKTASKTNSCIVAQLKTADIKGSNIIDQARVNFNENDNLVKYSLDKSASSLYFPQEGNEFAAVSFAGQSEMPLNFKVKHNGSYTLCFELENADVDYLHLIDNMTGADVDLLTTPSYTFEATTDDYEARFRLVFDPICEDTDDDNEHFAYYADGEIRLVETQNFASLQIVDMTGRIVFVGDAINRVSTSGMTAGVYVVRLINGEQVKTQKIVVR